MPRISACVIVKNEEKNIERWLSCAKQLADEIIIVDTGSTDRTVEMVRSAGVEPLFFEWINDFAAAKNFAIEHATGEWIVFLDADEYFMDRQIPQVKMVVNSIHENMAIDRITCQLVNMDADNNYKIQGTILTSRLFRNSVRYMGQIHEMLRPPEQGMGAAMVKDLTIYHTGYSSSVGIKKAQRNLEILENTYGTSGKVGAQAIYFADCYAVLKNFSKAAEYALQCMKIPKKDRLLPGEEYRVCITSWVTMGRPPRAVAQLIEEAIENYPKLMEFRFQKAMHMARQGKPLEGEDILREAIREYEEAPVGQDGKNLTDGSQQIYPSACVQMANICDMRLKDEETAMFYEKSLKGIPYQPVILKLWIKRLMGRLSEQEIIEKLDAIYSPESDGAFLMSVLKELPLDEVCAYYASRLSEETSLTEGITVRPLTPFERKLHRGEIEPIVEEIRNDFPRVLDMTAWVTNSMNRFSLQEEVAKLALPEVWQEALRVVRNGDSNSSEEAVRIAERIRNFVPRAVEQSPETEATEESKETEDKGFTVATSDESDDHNSEERVENKTSIIILSYNTLNMTQMCIESIRRHTENGSYEIIVVDNGSKDGSVEWLREQGDVRLIANEENKGFPGGCNQGLRIAKGSELLLLNSDTIVTPRWLDQLKEALYSSPEIGAVSCVTNSSAPVQKIDVPYGTDLNGIQPFAESYNHSNPDRWERKLMLIGFCYLFKREVYERIGGLDEAFSPGNYEDDDYSLRIRAAGWKLLLCRDTFIHHFGGGSFFKSESDQERQETQEAYNAAMAKNREYLISKWNLSQGYRIVHPWIHQYAFEKSNPRIALLDSSAGEDAYFIQARYPEARITAIARKFGDAVLLSPDFSAEFCEDIEHNAASVLRGKYDAIFCCEPLDGWENSYEFVKGLTDFLAENGKIVYWQGGNVNVFQ